MPTGRGRDQLISGAVLDGPHCTLSQAIGLGVVRAAGHVLKLILLSEAGELSRVMRAILWAIVTHDGHWKSMSSKHRL